VDIRSDKCRIGVEAPREHAGNRGEIQEKIDREGRA
jgi:sRNA-binding carbon storage regulator CsrA